MLREKNDQILAKIKSYINKPQILSVRVDKLIEKDPFEMVKDDLKATKDFAVNNIVKLLFITTYSLEQNTKSLKTQHCTT